MSYAVAGVLQYAGGREVEQSDTLRFGYLNTYLPTYLHTSLPSYLPSYLTTFSFSDLAWLGDALGAMSV